MTEEQIIIGESADEGKDIPLGAESTEIDRLIAQLAAQEPTRGEKLRGALITVFVTLGVVMELFIIADTVIRLF